MIPQLVFFKKPTTLYILYDTFHGKMLKILFTHRLIEKKVQFNTLLLKTNEYTNQHIMFLPVFEKIFINWKSIVLRI